MKRIIICLLLIALLISNIAILNSCASKDGNDGDNDGTSDGGSTGNPENNDTKPSEKDKITVPEYKDYGRNTVDFSEIIYQRPQISSLIDSFNNTTQIISENKIPFEDQVSAVEALEDGYFNLYTMYSLANIYSSRNSQDSVWQEEYEYISTKMSAFSQAVEELFIAAARSPHAEQFEEEYFGEDLIEKYADGGIYTDTVVALMAEEAALESDYTSISTSNVIIKTVDGKEGTLDELLKEIEDIWGKDSQQYNNYKISYTIYYEAAAKEKMIPIFVDLVKVRIRLAEEMGYSGYTELAYEQMGHDYSPEAMRAFAKNIKENIYPVYQILYEGTFYNYFKENMPSKLDEVKLINTLYSVYGGHDEELSEIYAYMLQHGLFDISPSVVNRQDISFTTYLYDNNSPFIFMTTDGYVTDYLTLAHEFGHFVDGYANDGENTSIDLAEVSSQGLELISMLYLETRLAPDDYKFLEYYELYNALNVLLSQTLYSEFEHNIYELDYDEVSVDTLTNALNRASVTLFDAELGYTVSDMVIYHTVMMPHYTQSYSTSIVAALEIFFLEVESEGEGLSAYKEFISRGDTTYTFTERLSHAGLSDPFSNETMRSLADKIHFHIRGQYFFTNSDNLINAA